MSINKPKRNGNLKGNTQSTRNQIPEEERENLKKVVFEAIVQGTSRNELAKTHGVAWETIDKLFTLALDEAGKAEDPASILRRDLVRMERAYDKCTRDYHAGRCKATEFTTMSAHWHKYNGVDRLIDTIAPQQQYVSLKVEVVPTEIELPPDVNQ